MCFLLSCAFYFLAMIISEISWVLDKALLFAYKLCIFASDRFDKWR